MKKMQVHGVNLDVMTNQPVVILKDVENKRFLPIWIGQFEATSILMELQGVKSTRPLTHDLMRSIFESLDIKLKKVVINNIEDGTFFARIHVESNSEELDLDARPSDAIALAVRVKAPIYADEEVVEKASIISEDGEEEEVERFKDFIETVNPEDFTE
ncbi:hypothetical protein LCGC14_1075630 [marine sediment metagenome]|uniref:BFN domain-containing protein n=1 Tax=marine sediment metagenome TaxID=412755 RepID=A0A0F9MGP5_9ZZZZ